jgi:site-specific recombinase XerD
VTPNSPNSRPCEALRAYLPVRPAADAFVFQSKFGRGLGARSIQNVITKCLQAAGIHDASVHDLRHTFPVHTLKQGMGLAVLHKVLGHAGRKEDDGSVSGPGP